MDCILDNALNGLSPLKVRIVLKTAMSATPAQAANKFSSEN